MADLTKKSDNRGFWGSLLRLKRESAEISGPHVGPIFSTEDLLIMETAAVAGDLVAPRVTVQGLVYGHIGAREVIVGETGQIWGDVYGAAVYIEPGAKVYGWLTTLSETSAAQLLNQENNLADLTPAINAIPPDVLEQSGLNALLESQDGLRPDERLNLLHELQAAAGAALTARAELEKQFEEKVHEQADAAINEAADLRESVAVLREHITSLQDAALARDDESAAQQTELTAVRDLLQERTVERDELRALNKQRQTELTKLQENYKTVRQQFATADDERKNLSERLSGIEIALQASLQRAAEQEEALVHWQELADSTERRATELEKDLAKSRQTNQESGQRLELLQSQRQKLQKAYDQAQAQLADWQSRAGKAEAQTSEYEAQITALREQLDTRPPASEEALAELTAIQEDLKKADGRVAELESYLQRLEVEAKDYFDQLIAYKTDLEESRKQLTSAQTALKERTEQLARAQAEMGERQDQVDKWKANVGRMTELLYDAEQRAKDLRQTLDGKEAREPEDKNLRELLQQRQVQLEASEAEAARYHQEMEAQSQRLAETQAALIEREVALSRAEGIAAQKESELNRLKKAAVTRIQKLEKELAQARGNN
jgi:chromosome segregation ATPase